MTSELEVIACRATARACLSVQIVEHHDGEDRETKRACVLQLAGWQPYDGRWICAHHAESTQWRSLAPVVAHSAEGETEQDYYRPQGCGCPEPFVRHEPTCATRCAPAPVAAPEPAVVTAIRKPRQLVDTATAALLAGRSQRTIRRWATTEGRLCAYGTKARLLVDLEEVRELCRLLGRAPLSDRSGREKMPA